MWGTGGRGDVLCTWLFPALFPRDKDVSGGSVCEDCWELLSKAISWQCPCSKDMTAPDRVGEGETHWCNPAGPFALGMGFLG